MPSPVRHSVSPILAGFLGARFQRIEADALRRWTARAGATREDIAKLRLAGELRARAMARARDGEHDEASRTLNTTSPSSQYSNARSRLTDKAFQGATRAYLLYRRGLYEEAMRALRAAADCDVQLVCRSGIPDAQVHYMHLLQNGVRVLAASGDSRAALNEHLEHLSRLEGAPLPDAVLRPFPDLVRLEGLGIVAEAFEISWIDCLGWLFGMPGCALGAAQGTLGAHIRGSVCCRGLPLAHAYLWSSPASMDS